MPSVAPCPYCGQTTAIPHDIDAAAIVRCPLCEYEFELGHALMNAAEAPPEHIAEFPAELIPMVSAAVAQASAEAGDANGSGEAGAMAIESPPIDQSLTASGHLPFLETGPSVSLRAKPRASHPIRNFVGMVVSGLFGLAVAYALLNWIGPPQLRFWNRPSSRADTSSAQLPEPNSDDAFPGVDANRFSEGANHVESPGTVPSAK